MTIKEEYFEWLCKLVENNKYDQSYILFLKWLHSMKYKLIVNPLDNNRLSDGIQLREEFRDRFDVYEEPLALNGPCSFLEFLIAIALKIDFMISSDNSFVENPASKWFWLLISNLRLIVFKDTDNNIFQKENHNWLILEKFMKREYSPNGVGGLFPLNNPQSDQRKIEIWYQMNAYINEMEFSDY